MTIINTLASLLKLTLFNPISSALLSKLFLQSETDSGLTLLLVLIGCLCGFVALAIAIVVVILVIKKGKASSSYQSVFNSPDDHFSVMD